jgi:hypothetical protein
MATKPATLSQLPTPHQPATQNLPKPQFGSLNQPAQHTTAGAQPVAQPQQQSAMNIPVPPTARPVEELVVPLNNRQRSTVTEQNTEVNDAIQDSQLNSGEIAIDRQGLIHHSKEDEDL